MSEINATIVSKVCTKCNEEKVITEFNRKKASNDGHRPECRKCHSISNRIYVSLNKERQAAAVKKWYDANREHERVMSKAHYEANKERVAIRGKKYREENKERVASKNKRWSEANKDKCASYRRARRARKQEATGSHTIDDINNLFKLQRKKCASCNKSISKYYEVDHIVALVNGGSDDKHNLQLLCMTCNRSKGSKDPIAFMNANGRLL